MFANLLPLLAIASISFSVLPARASKGCTALETASYTMTYTAVWANPSSVDGSQYSKMYGVSHNESYSIFTVGKKVTPDVKNLTEEDDEWDLYIPIVIGSCYGFSSFVAPGIEMTNGTTKSYLNVTKEFPLVSALARLAPSPDWFVGVNNVNLCKGNVWLPTVTTNVYPYDAGTHSGKQWESPDIATDPQNPVTRLYTATDPAHAFRNYSNATWGTVTFQRAATLLDSNLTIACERSSQASVYTHLSVPPVLWLVVVSGLV